MNDAQSTPPPGYCQCGCGEKTKIAEKTDRRAGHAKGEPLRYVLGHGARRPLAARFARFVGAPDANACWPWQGTIADNGYGRLSQGYTSIPAHRFAYEHLVGPVPTDAVLDHLCRNRRCVNPAHLEPVAHPENCRRGTSTKLTAADVVAIRDALAAGVVQTVLADRYGVTQPTICRIGKHRRWATLNEPQRTGAAAASSRNGGDSA